MHRPHIIPSIHRAIRDALPGPTPDAQGRMVLALHGSGKHVYAGTVPEHVQAKRRRRNQLARASRRANRK